ncbi:MAG: succinylglutamate desuccinylase [Aestuariibacter sp.]
MLTQQTSIQDIQQFLQISRRHPELVEQPFQLTLSNQTLVTVKAPGVICFEPEDAGCKDVVYSCGIHGNETAPIEICDELVQRIFKEEVVLRHRLMVIFGNLPAMDIAERFVEENMNRLFSGEHANPNIPVNAERRRAALLEEQVKQFFDGAADGNRQRFHYDLHTAIRDSKNEKFAVYPFTHGAPRSSEQLVFLQKCGVETILLSESPTTTFSYFSARQFGAHAFTVELGKVRPFGQNDMSRFSQAKATLTQLVSVDDMDLSGFDSANFDIYTVNQIINRETDDFELCFNDDTPNFTDYQKGTILARDGKKNYVAQQDGEAIVFPNAKVALGQRALLTVVPASLNE